MRNQRIVLVLSYNKDVFNATEKDFYTIFHVFLFIEYNPTKFMSKENPSKN